MLHTLGSSTIPAGGQVTLVYPQYMCVCLSVCPSVCLCLSVCMCNMHLSFLLIARAVRGRLPQTGDLWKRASMGRVSSHAVSRWSPSPAYCGFRGAFWVRRDFVFCKSFHFQIRRVRSVSVDSVKRQRQPANLPTENSRPPIPTRCTIYYAPT